MNINHVVWTRSNWFAEINTGMIIGERKPMRLSFAHKLRLLLENPAVLKSWRIPKELRYFDRKIQQRISFTCSASILHGMYDSLALSLSLRVRKKSKATASHVLHTRAYGTSNTGALCIHSDELKNITDRLTERETLKCSVRVFSE